VAQEGSLNSIELLFRQYHKVLCNLARNIVRDKDAAEDIVQDVFLKLWNMRDEFDFTVPVKPYLYKATTNTAISWLNKNKQLPLGAEISDTDSGLVSSFNAEDKILEKELQVKILQAIDRLPPKCKAIFILSRYEGLKYRQIAEYLDISVKTVENQMCIALDRLRKDLEPYLTREFLGLISALAGLLAILFS
jgi:RNA polymerase sigma-70 factor, ECF subfamily